jgi:hypothetical protein
LGRLGYRFTGLNQLSSDSAIIVAFGDTALVPGIIGAAIIGAVFLPTGIVAAEIDRGKGNPTERSAISRFFIFLVTMWVMYVFKNKALIMNMSSAHPKMCHYVNRSGWL